MAWRTTGYIDDELAIHKIKTPDKTTIKPAKWRLHRRIDNRITSNIGELAGDYIGEHRRTTMGQTYFDKGAFTYYYVSIFLVFSVIPKSSAFMVTELHSILRKINHKSTTNRELELLSNYFLIAWVCSDALTVKYLHLGYPLTPTSDENTIIK